MTDTTRPPASSLRARNVEGEMFVSIADVLVWMRGVSEALVHTADASPAQVVDRVADDLRDEWLDATR